MTDARKDQAMKDHPNLGQDEAEEERASDEKLDHLHREPSRRDAAKSPQRRPEKPSEPAPAKS